MDMPVDLQHLNEHGIEGDLEVAAPTDDAAARQLAIRRIAIRRRFVREAVTSALGMILLMAVWATSEYHNAGGWPIHGFSQSSSIHDVWNLWIIYPVGGWLLILSSRAWYVLGGRPISEREIQRELTRQAARR
ncbi:MAG: hypothetical protein ACHQFZ_06110 [Acidimicrobiales bacterium]